MESLEDRKLLASDFGVAVSGGRESETVGPIQIDAIDDLIQRNLVGPSQLTLIGQLNDPVLDVAENDPSEAQNPVTTINTTYDSINSIAEEFRIERSNQIVGLPTHSVAVGYTEDIYGEGEDAAFSNLISPIDDDTPVCPADPSLSEDDPDCRDEDTTADTPGDDTPTSDPPSEDDTPTSDPPSSDPPSSDPPSDDDQNDDPPPPSPIVLASQDTRASEPGHLFCDIQQDRGSFTIFFPADYSGGPITISATAAGTSRDYTDFFLSSTDVSITSTTLENTWQVSPGNSRGTATIYVTPQLDELESDSYTVNFNFTSLQFNGSPTQGSANVTIVDELEQLRLIPAPGITSEGSEFYGAFLIENADRICTPLRLRVDLRGLNNAPTTIANPSSDYILTDQNDIPIVLNQISNDFADVTLRVDPDTNRLATNEIRVVAAADSITELDEDVKATLSGGLLGFESAESVVTIEQPLPSIDLSRQQIDEPHLISCGTTQSSTQVTFEIPENWPDDVPIEYTIGGTASPGIDYELTNLGPGISIIGDRLRIVKPSGSGDQTVTLTVNALTDSDETDSGETIEFVRAGGSGDTEATITITDASEGGSLTANPSSVEEGETHGDFVISGTGAQLCTHVYLRIDTNPDDSAELSDYTLMVDRNGVPTPLTLTHQGGGIYHSDVIDLENGDSHIVDVHALADFLAEQTEVIYAELIIPALPLDAGEAPPSAQMSITDDVEQHQIVLATVDGESEEPHPVYCGDHDPFGSVSISLPPAWAASNSNASELSVRVSTNAPTPGVDFVIAGVSFQSDGLAISHSFNSVTGELKLTNIPKRAGLILIETLALNDFIETDPETIEFSWISSSNQYPQFSFAGDGAVEIDDLDEGLMLTASPGSTFEYGGPPGTFHVRPESGNHLICESVILRIDTTKDRSATPGADYILVAETGQPITLHPSTQPNETGIFYTNPIIINHDNDFEIDVIAVNDGLREGDEIVYATLLDPTEPDGSGENDNAEVTIVEKYLVAQIEKELEQDPVCGCSSHGLLDLATNEVNTTIAGLLQVTSDPLNSAFPIARLVLPIPDNGAVPSSIDVAFHVISEDENDPFNRKFDRTPLTFTIDVAAMASDDVPPAPGTSIAVNFQLDLLDELLTGGPVELHALEVNAIPTFEEGANPQGMFSGWWGSASFPTVNPFAFEQATGLPPALAWQIDRLFNDKEFLTPENPETGVYVKESGSIRLRPNGSYSWYANGTDRPPESLADLSIGAGSTLSHRGGSKTFFAGGDSGYASITEDSAGNQTAWNVGTTLAAWAGGSSGTIDTPGNRTHNISYEPYGNAGSGGGDLGDDSNSQPRVFTITDPYGATTTITWAPNPAPFTPVGNPPPQSTWWAISSGAEYQPSSGGTLTVVYPDPDGDGPRLALQEVYNINEQWFLESIERGEIDQSPIQTYSFGFDFDPTAAAGEVGDRAIYSVTFNDITTTVDFARRRQDLVQFTWTPELSIKAWAIAGDSTNDSEGGYSNITSVTDGNGNRSLYRLDHRGRIYQSMDAYFVHLLGLNTLDLSTEEGNQAADQALRDYRSLTTQYVLSPTARDPFGRIVGEDRGDVLSTILPDPDDFTRRLELPDSLQINGPLDRPQFSQSYVDSNPISLNSPLIDEQTWQYNAQFDIPTLYTDEHGIEYRQEIDEAVGRVSRREAGQIGWYNHVSPLDVNGDGWIRPQDVLIASTFYRNNLGFRYTENRPPEEGYVDTDNDGRAHPADFLRIRNYINVNGSTRTEIGADDFYSLREFEYTQPGGSLPAGMITRQTVLNGHSDDSVIEYVYYDTPSDPSTHAMLYQIIEQPGSDIEAITTFEYDSRANVSKVIDPAGREIQYFYDTLDRMTMSVSVDPDADLLLIPAITRYDYDVFGNLVATELLNSYFGENDFSPTITSLIDGYEYDEYNRQIASYQQTPEVTWYVTESGGQLTYSQTRPSLQYISSSLINEIGESNPRIATTANNPEPMTPANQPGLRGAVVEYEYDNNHNLLTSTISDNGQNRRTTTWTYDRANRPIIVVTPDPGGTEATVHVEIRNDDATLGEIGGYVNTTIFDNLHRPTSSIDTLGRTFHTRYDQLGRTSSIAYPNPEGGQLESFVEYESVRKLGWNIISTDPLGRQTSTQTNFRGDTISVELPDGAEYRYEYYFDGSIERVRQPDVLAPAVTYDYDSRGRPTEVTDAEGNSTTYVFANDNLLQSVTDPLGRETTFVYDAAGRRTITVAPDPDGSGLDHFTSGSHVAYDSIGNVIFAHDNLRRGTRYEYDSRFRTIASTQGGEVNDIFVADSTTEYEYDVFGKLELVRDPNSNETTYGYDRLDRVYRETKGDFGDRISEIDGVGNLRRYTDRNGRQTRFVYDILDRPVQETWNEDGSDIRAFLYEYDAVGNLLSASDIDTASGETLSPELNFSYDSRDRLIAESSENPFTNQTAIFQRGYDGRSLQTSVQLNLGGTLNPTSGTVFGGVNDLFNQYSYDDRGWLTSVSQQGEGIADKSAAFSYNAAGQLTDIKRYSSLTESNLVAHSRYGYDLAGRLTSITHASDTIGADEHWNGTSNLPSSLDSNSLLAAYTLQYEATADRLIGFSSYFDGYEATFQYDVKGQLTDADYFGIAGLTPTVTLPSPEDYSFDANGNRGSSAAGEHNRVSSNAGSQFQYDEEGNQLLQNRSDGSTRETFFDHRNRLVQVINRGVTIHYQYDAFDRRTGREVDRNSDGIIDERTVWIWDGQQVVLQQIDADGDAGPADFEATNRYLYGASVDQLLADEQLSVASPVETTDPLGGPLDGPTFGGPTFDDPTTSDPTAGDDSVPTDNVLWALTDHLGSVRDLIDSSGTRREHIHYDTFGNVVSETDYDASGNEIASDHAEAVDTLFGYTGREWDEEAELQFNRARWYDPKQGRWLSQDAIGFAAGDANLYRYVGNGSTTATDPSGLEIYHRKDSKIGYYEVWADGWLWDTHLGNVAYNIDTYNSVTAEKVAQELYDQGNEFGVLYLGDASSDLLSFWDTGLGKLLGLARTDVGFGHGCDVARGKAMRDEFNLRRNWITADEETYDDISKIPWIGNFSKIALGEMIRPGETESGAWGLSQEIATQVTVTAGGSLLTLRILRTTKTAAPNSGVGKYSQVKGHHLHAKAGFKDAANYSKSKGWSISQKYMKDRGWDHQAMTNKQRELFNELAQSGRANTLKEHTRIAVEALQAGGATRAQARQLVADSLRNLREQGVRFPTNIPWN